jgi:hypothetical protein
MTSATDIVSGARASRYPPPGPRTLSTSEVPTQLAEELLQVRKGNFLPLGHSGQRYRCFRAVHRDVDHRGNGESSFGGESHDRSPVVS